MEKLAKGRKKEIKIGGGRRRKKEERKEGRKEGRVFLADAGLYGVVFVEERTGQRVSPRLL